ncbi:hypothetical protein [Dickeya zeae]|uniref:hypothetical protein n=1 Tax=Dickeya zeae TaxID=204042 RepID=UPI000C9B46BE|nr:hypothetical protein [Dickeya zeae]AUQ25164.1 hypothetical protein C1O30_08835 [Dickeya zeae]UJR58246.1 hypothetical protein HJ580_08735 [Dickeya zeae]
MDLKVIKENFVSLIFVVLALSGWTAYNYKSLLSFQEYKNNQLDILRERELVVKKQESVLAYREESLSRRLAESEQKFKAVEVANADLALREQALSASLTALAPQQKREKAKAEIDGLISSFSMLGINLQKLPACKDSDMIKRFNQAEVLLTEITSKIKSAKLEDSYRYFLDSNTRWIYTSETCENN